MCYQNIEDYKIGYTFKYTTANGESAWNIIKPRARMKYVFKVCVCDLNRKQKGAL